jgi:hypothetical protein
LMRSSCTGVLDNAVLAKKSASSRLMSLVFARN